MIETEVKGDTTIMKVCSRHSPKGDMRQKYLASGIHVSMRLWQEEPPGEPKPMTQRDYETVGYVIEGRAELHLEKQMILLDPGDSWLVPRVRHTPTKSWSVLLLLKPPLLPPWCMLAMSHEVISLD